ncbi:hypothetical protein BWI17_00645 [Betaproteobacteria bacterium GR16-43]|nr:hypothetical protein BWI17_00645 [Betaproteobacteria bacterium GR16-43]
MRHLGFLAACSISGVAIAGVHDDIIANCWKGRDHPAMTSCVREYAQAAQAALNHADRDLRQALVKSQDEVRRRDDIKRQLDASASTYRKFRDAECSLTHTLASQGNGATENQWACEAALDEQQAQRLRAAKWWLK